MDLAAALVHLAPYLQQQAASPRVYGSAAAMPQVHQQVSVGTVDSWNTVQLVLSINSIAICVQSVTTAFMLKAFMFLAPTPTLAESDAGSLQPPPWKFPSHPLLPT